MIPIRLNILSNIILPCTPRFTIWSLTFMLPTKILRISRCPSHVIILNLIALIRFPEHYKLSSSLRNFFQDPNLIIRTLVSNALNLLYSLNVRDQASHQYKTADKTLYILTLTFLDVKYEDLTKHHAMKTYW